MAKFGGLALVYIWNLLLHHLYEDENFSVTLSNKCISGFV